MQKLAELAREYQAMLHRGVDDRWASNLEVLKPLTENSSITDVYLMSITPHAMRVMCRIGKKVWAVKVIPTFNGVQVRVSGNDIDNIKSQISAKFREVFK